MRTHTQENNLLQELALASQVCTGAILHFCHDVDPLIPFSFSDSESFGHGVLVLVNPSSKDVQLQG